MGNGKVMIEQAQDFRDESDALYALLEPLDDAQWRRPTQFKGWTANDIVAHLHWGNFAADLALRDAAAFGELARRIMAGRHAGSASRVAEAGSEGLSGRALLARWREYYGPMAERFADADPRRRVPWFGPDMSVRSSITARLMETWAHAQALYDLLGKTREDTDRIKNIAVLGINTFGWTFANRGLPVPADKPHVRLTAPSGALWEWGAADSANLIEGLAVEFCQVVAQTRNVADTGLRVVGATAAQWMAIAQCFAGPPHDPPAPGTRFRQR
ncbi:MAG TPA: TIGR03084 family metal-binding protein [Candidatus Binataceae bacterium]|nr:TIGR03084 family metal-binding protein [Candidatus Binataceae bacterium]